MSAPLDAQWKPDWPKHCDACLGYYTSNPAEVHCQGDYTATYPECLAGGRTCVPDGQGRRGRGKAFKLTLICQGHDGTAHEHLKAAGRGRCAAT